MERRLREELSTPRRGDRILLALWYAEATVKHWFGIHTMLPLEEWDFIEEVVQMKGLICWKCGYQL